MKNDDKHLRVGQAKFRPRASLEYLHRILKEGITPQEFWEEHLHDIREDPAKLQALIQLRVNMSMLKLITETVIGMVDSGMEVHGMTVKSQNVVRIPKGVSPAQIQQLYDEEAARLLIDDSPEPEA